jgi:glycosyltransferase involved in cell wall biosynthesis
MKSIYFITPDMDAPSAGVLNIYKHVINLNKMGFKAYVVHFRKQFETIKWHKFGADRKYVKTMFLDEMFTITQKGQFVKANREFSGEDVVVIPEGFMGLFHIFTHQFKFKCKKVLYAQSWSYIVPSIAAGFQGQIPNFQQLGVDHVIAVSEAVRRFVIDAFHYPEEKISMLTNTIDTSIFNSDLGMEKFEEVIEDADGNLDITTVERPVEKKNQIAFMPRRGVDINYQLTFMLFKSISPYKEWEIKPIVGLDNKGVAEILKESKIFVHYTDGEGFGYPPLEALLTGNIVVGNKGLGGEEFIDNELACDHHWITPDDIKNAYSWVSALNSAIENWDSKMKHSVNVEVAKERYSEQKQTDQLKSIFTSFKE